MTDYAGLTLDGAKIEDAIRGFPGLKNVAAPKLGKDFTEYKVEAEGQASALLQVFERGDGRFTLKFKVGKNQVLSEKLAQHVADACKCDPQVTKPLTLSSISEDDWKFLQESLTEDGLKLEAEPHVHAERFKVSGPGKDHVWIHRFKTGKFVMQGRTRNVYSAVVNCLSYTKTERKELIESQLATMPVTVTECGTLMADLEQRIPEAWPKMDDTVKTILAPALLVHKLSADLPDYSLMVFPALRGMEGCIKDLFAKRRYVLGAKLSIGDQFDQSTKKVTPTVQAKLGCLATCTAVEEIYGHFSKHRNGLLHVDSIVATTRIIEKQAEAAEIVDTAFHVIEKSYASVP
jgi:hypothetical protein